MLEHVFGSAYLAGLPCTIMYFRGQSWIRNEKGQQISYSGVRVKHELTVHNVDSTCGNIWHVGQGSALFHESAQLAPLSYADHSARIFGDVQNCPDRLRTVRDVE